VHAKNIYTLQVKMVFKMQRENAEDGKSRISRNNNLFFIKLTDFCSNNVDYRNVNRFGVSLT